MAQDFVPPTKPINQPDEGFKPPTAPINQPTDVSLEMRSGTKPEPVDEDKFIPPTQPIPPPKQSLWDRANEPMVSLSPEMQKAMEYQTLDPSVTETLSDKMSRYGWNAAKFLGETARGMTSPLQATLMGLTGGASAAEELGMPGVAKALEMPARAASIGMIGHGLYNIGQGNIGSGLLESGLGALGARGNVAPVGSTIEEAGGTVPFSAGPMYGPWPKPPIKPPRGIIRSVIDAGTGLVDFTKSAVTTGHLTAPFRNAIWLANKGQFWSAFNEMYQSFGSEENFYRIQSGLQTLPDYQLMQGRMGIDFTNMAGRREDLMRSIAAEKIPGWGRYVRAGSRAFTAFNNVVRGTVAQDLINKFDDLAKLRGDPTLSPRSNYVLAEQLGRYVNNATGRGSLGSWEKNAAELNAIFMSPRMQAARFDMVRQIASPSTPYLVRKEAIKSLATVAAIGATLNGLAMYGGAETNFNPTSADFGKIKIGNTRLDPYAGAQQYVVAIARNAAGGTTTTTGRREGQFTRFGQRFPSGQTAPTRLDSWMDFAANHGSPPVRLAADWAKAKEKRGGQSTFEMGPEALGMVVPITAKQIYELVNEDPQLLPLMIPSTFGMSTETYGQGR